MYRQTLPCTSRRGLQKERLWNTRHESATNFVRWRVVSKSFFRQKLKGFIIKRQAKLTHDQAKHLHFYVPTMDSRQTRWFML